ncbi:MAG: O-antigen ligase family protein, partial [Acidobacteriota bacterium]|nr:O-antigen ligase family protein [Acidobacteriota bacterium]
MISSRESSALVSREAEARVVKPAAYVTYRIRHTLASRFAFLILCVAIILSALAYGTVHAWALAVFLLGSVAILVLWLVDSWMLGSVRISRNVLQLSLIGMFVLGVVQLLPFRDPGSTGTPSIPLIKSLSFDPYATRLILVEAVALLIYFAATLIFIDTPKRLRLLVRTLTIFGFLLAIFGLTQSFTSPNKVYWIRESTQSQPFGPFINRHHFAGYMELALAVPLGLIFSGSVEKEKRLIYLFAAGLMGVALIMTNSRGGIISLMAEILFLVAITGLKRRHRKKESSEKRFRIKSAAVKAGLALALIISLFGSVVLLGGEDVLSRLVGSVNTDDATTGRAHFWAVTTEIIKTHPFLGTGLGAFPVVYTGYDSRNGFFRLEQAHNDYLQVVSDGGLVGAALALFFVINLFRMGFARRESRDNFRRGVATGAMAGCFAVLVHSFFDFTLHTTANALLFLILAAMATMNGRVQDVQTRRKRRHSGESESVVRRMTGSVQVN